jgi:hypothetical protein
VSALAVVVRSSVVVVVAHASKRSSSGVVSLRERVGGWQSFKR